MTIDPEKIGKLIAEHDEHAEKAIEALANGDEETYEKEVAASDAPLREAIGDVLGAFPGWEREP